MPFNPNLPVDFTLCDAGQMRSQLNGLDDKINAIPAGPEGPQGPQGDPGPQGPAGEVSLAQLDGAIAGTAQNPSAIGPYTGSFSDPPTQAEMQDFAGYVETVRAALVR